MEELEKELEKKPRSQQKKADENGSKTSGTKTGKKTKTLGKKSGKNSDSSKKKDKTPEEIKAEELKRLEAFDLAQRSRRWNLILYPDCEAHMDILYYLTGDNPEHIQGYYILHKGEPATDEKNNVKIDENGNVVYKKDHYHVQISYDNPRTKRGVLKAFSHLIESPLVAKTQDINSTYLYMLHKTYDCFRAGKKVYQHSDIKLLGNNSLSLLNSVSGIESDLSEQIKDFISVGECCDSPVDFLKCFVNSEQHLKTILKNPYFIKTFCIKDADKKGVKKNENN